MATAAALLILGNGLSALTTRIPKVGFRMFCILTVTLMSLTVYQNLAQCTFFSNYPSHTQLPANTCMGWSATMAIFLNHLWICSPFNLIVLSVLCIHTIRTLTSNYYTPCHCFTKFSQGGNKSLFQFVLITTICWYKWEYPCIILSAIFIYLKQWPILTLFNWPIISFCYSWQRQLVDAGRTTALKSLSSNSWSKKRIRSKTVIQPNSCSLCLTVKSYCLYLHVMWLGFINLSQMISSCHHFPLILV